MTLYAEHIIGLRAVEHMREEDAGTIAAVVARYEYIRARGFLRGRENGKEMGEDGSLGDLDVRAGDGQYVFLSYGPRYRQLRQPQTCYGFIFDAVRLIRDYGALVGPDLLHHYDDILDRVARRVDKKLPPLPAISEAELAEFMALTGEDDPGMAAYIRQSSTSRYHDLCDGVRFDDASALGGAEAIDRFERMARRIQRWARVSGQRALTALQPGVEILVPSPLPLSAAIGCIEGGEIVLW